LLSPKVGESIITKGKKPLGKKITLLEGKGGVAFGSANEFLLGSITTSRTQKVILDVSVAKKVLSEAFKTTTGKIKLRIIDLRKNVNTAIKKGKTTVTVSANTFNQLDIGTQNSLISAQVVKTIPITTTIKIETPPPPKLDFKFRDVSLDFSSVILGSKEIVKTKEKEKLMEKIKEKEKIKMFDLTKTISFQKVTPSLKTKQLQKPLQLLRQPQIIKQVTIPVLEFFQPQIPIEPLPPKPIPAKIKIPKLFYFDKKVKKQKKASKEFPSYDVTVKSKGKQRKITPHPIAKQQAMNLGSYLVDNALSAEFSIKGSSKQPRQPKIKVPQKFWNFNVNKFRNYRIKKGKRIPMINKWIEKKPQRLDTPGEVSGITISRLLKQQKKKSINISKTSKALNKAFGISNMFS
jgi:hypothetical protein